MPVAQFDRQMPESKANTMSTMNTKKINTQNMTNMRTKYKQNTMNIKVKKLMAPLSPNTNSNAPKLVHSVPSSSLTSVSSAMLNRLISC